MRFSRHEATDALRFAGKVLAVIGSVITVLWIIGALFALSRWAGFVAVGVVAVALYATAHHWVLWLPGLLIFGVLNSLLALVTHRAPTNRQVTVSTGLAVLLLAFYTVGCVVSYYAEHVSVLDRCAWLLYLAAMVLPVAFASTGRGVVTPSIATATAVGMAAVMVSFASHRIQRHKRVIGT